MVREFGALVVDAVDCRNGPPSLPSSRKPPDGTPASPLGRIQGAAREAFFDTIDVLMVPSEWEEPAALVVYEAAVRAIPTVVSDRGGLPEAPEASVFRAGEAEDLGRATFALAEPGVLAKRSARLLASHETFLWSGHAARVEGVLAAAAKRT